MNQPFTPRAVPKQKPLALRLTNHHLPIALATIGLLIGGFFLLHRSEAQARDTIRKHHLQDIEEALYFAYSQQGTYPPYDQPAWCGFLRAASDTNAYSQIEEVLRQQNEKYANPDKPFPIDPLAEDQSPREAPPLAERSGADQVPTYFYWKRSPAVFELYSILETDPNHTRSTSACAAQPDQIYDYGLNSRLRQALTAR